MGGGGGVSSRGGLVIDCPPGGWPGAAGSDRHLLQGMGPMPRHYYWRRQPYTGRAFERGLHNTMSNKKREFFVTLLLLSF